MRLLVRIRGIEVVVVVLRKGGGGEIAGWGFQWLLRRRWGWG